MIAFYLGADGTDSGRLLRSVLRSREILGSQSIIVPPPRHYRNLTRAALTVLNGDTSAAERVGALMDEVAAREPADRLVMFAESVFSEPGQAVDGHLLYPLAPLRLAAFRALLQGRPMEFHLALCNPATIAQALGTANDGARALTGAEARELSWLATMTEIIRTNPGIRLTLWCYEDAALIWPEVLRALSGYRGPSLLDGDNDMLAMLLTEEGYRSLARSLLARPPRSVAERRDRIGTALEADAKPDVLALDISLPGWGGDDVRVISERYEEDCAEIARLPGVTFIAA